MTEDKTTQKPRTEKSAPPSAKRLVRLPEQGKIFGVCAGLSAYTEIDVSVMRIIFVILTLASGGFGILVYLVLALIMPTQTGAAAALKSGDISENVNNLAQEFRDSGVADTWRRYMGIALIVFGAWLLFVNFFPEWIDFDWELVWPALLVLFGILLIIKGKR